MFGITEDLDENPTQTHIVCWCNCWLLLINCFYWINVFVYWFNYIYFIATVECNRKKSIQNWRKKPHMHGTNIGKLMMNYFEYVRLRRIDHRHRLDGCSRGDTLPHFGGRFLAWMEGLWKKLPVAIEFESKFVLSTPKYTWLCRSRVK